jgi:glutamyl-tRNA synthetase
MHLGNARSALLGWLWSKSTGGEFHLRIEDLDRARCRPEHVDALYRDLEYLGLHWDGPVLFQSQRSEIYDAALEKLRAAGRVFPCFCTRSEIARAATAPHGPSDDGPRYPAICEHLTAEQVAERARSRPPAIRFRPSNGITRFVDAIHGDCEQDVDAEVGAFVVRRNDGVASYQLAVVVDDAASGITQVLRADDLLSSTARQLQLYEALDLPVPRFAHVPLLIGGDGKRLAKREGGWTVAQFRKTGVSPQRVVGLLAKWSGLSSGEPISAQELVADFSLSRIRKESVVVEEEPHV